MEMGDRDDFAQIASLMLKVPIIIAFALLNTLTTFNCQGFFKMAARCLVFPKIHYAKKVTLGKLPLGEYFFIPTSKSGDLESK
jgi:hypothetical protein